MSASLLDLPEAWPLPSGFHRHEPTPTSQRNAILSFGTRVPWADLRWPALVEELFALGRTDIPLGRLTEGHLDALRILHEAGEPPVEGAAYGVWASRSHGTGVRLDEANADPDVDRGDDETVQLAGTLRFASGAGVLDRALVPVWVSEDEHLLLDLSVKEWSVDESAWKTTAMAASRSHTICLDGVTATGRQIADRNFYLGRTGFHLGGVGVAAVWVGGCARILDLLDEYQGARRSPAQEVRRGVAATDLAAAVAVCRQTAQQIATGSLTDPRATATIARAVVAAAGRRILEQARVLAGPAGLAHDLALTRAIDDLQLYLGQQHIDGDAQYLGAWSVT